MNFASLKYDFVFREVFSHENILKCFVSDVTGIRKEDINSIRLTTPYLWKRYRQQKLGILDIAAVMNDNTRLDIELQIRAQKHWIKRGLFYLAKMYTGDMKTGQKYDRLRKCILISLLDFSLIPGKNNHTVYRLRDENGQEFTDLFEIHIIELKKEPEDCSPLNDWLQLINAENVEELDMIRTCNTGIMEAIEAVKTMNLIKSVRYLYEAHLKAVRDRWAEDEYVKDQGKAEAKTEWLLQMLDGLGTVPDGLREQILAQADLDTLDKWFTAAGKAGSLQEFCGLAGLDADLSRDTF